VYIEDWSPALFRRLPSLYRCRLSRSWILFGINGEGGGPN
jgi:hypothetical protein